MPSFVTAIRTAPTVALALLILPVLLGLAGVVAPAFGWHPALGGETWTLAHWQALGNTPGLVDMIRLSLFTGLASALATFGIVALCLATFLETRAFGAIRRLLSPLLAVPHAAAAIGLAFLLTPRAWPVAWSRPGSAAGSIRPTTCFRGTRSAWPGTRADAQGDPLPAADEPSRPAPVPRRRTPDDGTRAGLWADQCLSQGRVAGPLPTDSSAPLRGHRLRHRQHRGGHDSRSLDAATPGRGRGALAGRSRPRDALPGRRGSTAAARRHRRRLLIWWLGERLVSRLAAGWLRDGHRLRGERLGRGIGSLTTWLAIGVLVAALAGLILWSLAGYWPFPEAWPAPLTLHAWQQAATGLGDPLSSTVTIGLAATAIALVLTLGCLEAETHRRRPLGAGAQLILYLPLLVPQVAFLQGLVQWQARSG